MGAPLRVFRAEKQNGEVVLCQMETLLIEIEGYRSSRVEVDLLKLDL